MKRGKWGTAVDIKSDRFGPARLSITQAQIDMPAALFSAGECLATGTVKSCIVAWTRFGPDTRRRAYIQPKVPIGGKQALRLAELAEIAANI
jgi:hypothetical protein